jgi:galactokinase
VTSDALDVRAAVDAAFAGLADAASPAYLSVPGRIEVFGKHTDYAGGRSLTCATERDITVAFAPRQDGVVSLVDAADGRRESFQLMRDLAPTVGHWSNYPMTVARRLARNFSGLAVGANIAFKSTIPRAAGLSTSSALVTAVYLVLEHVNRLSERAEYQLAIPTREALAGYLGSIENGQAFGGLQGDHGVGTFGGSEDHTAILLSERDRLAWYRYRPVTRLGAVSLSAELTFVVGASGVTAAKTGGARERYNRAATLVTALVGEWRKKTGREDPTLADAIASGPDAVDRLRDIAATGLAPFGVEPLQQRLEHFLVEDGVLVPAAIEALQSGSLDDLGRISDESQRATERLLGNQVPETSALARLARQHGALAASAFGAGFGGSVWALVPIVDATQFTATWQAAYAAEHASAASEASFFSTRPAEGAHRI